MLKVSTRWYPRQRATVEKVISCQLTKSRECYILPIGFQMILNHIFKLPKEVSCYIMHRREAQNIKLYQEDVYNNQCHKHLAPFKIRAGTKEAHSHMVNLSSFFKLLLLYSPCLEGKTREVTFISSRLTNFPPYDRELQRIQQSFTHSNLPLKSWQTKKSTYLLNKNCLC